MGDRSLAARTIHESKSVRTAIELFVVFLGLVILYTVIAPALAWPPLLAPSGPWPTLIAGLIIIAGHLAYGLYVDRSWTQTKRGVPESGEEG